MDLSNPDTWTNGAAVVMNAPHIVVPLMIVVAGAAWWLRSRIGKGQIDAYDQRLLLANEQKTDLNSKLTAAKQEIDLLTAQLTSGAPREQLTATVRSTESLFDDALTANSALGVTLTPTSGRYRLLYEPITKRSD
jgi:hypothetical protein